jgi:hypothetical protein
LQPNASVDLRKVRLDVLLDKKSEEKVIADPSGFSIRVAYQQPISMAFKSASPTEALANTFEDALVYENPTLFGSLEGHGLIAKFRDALANCADIGELAVKVSEALETGNKAEFALDLLYSEEVKDLKAPGYIHDGLEWLAEQLRRKEEDVLGKSTAAPA